ncbi:glutamate ABC transporter substrate-binding protein [Actinomadura sp. NBRC 104412]|uniref:glutamate ABC transporter substrate-binding protein n=1 Tax=Actinomadura sp. NBRC 104412 TaxID=3032203 RepID=UPI00255764CA|nr:glutamate ABC transporter substrate-binding protein [Actinomadura sp. NBRC 104412]
MRRATPRAIVRRLARALLRAAVAGALSAAVAGCGSSGTASIADRDALVVGVKADQPGLGLSEDGRTFRGFEVDVGRYIAHHMGASRVSFKEVTSANREPKLDAGEVDLVLASYSITADRSTLVTFGGPYYVAHQDMMVRRGDTRFRTARDMAGHRMCQAAGSVSTERVVEGLGIPARLVPALSYASCVAKLLSGEVDVVSTGDLVLAGFAARSRTRLEIVNAPFTEERYGVGLRKGDIAGCEAVNRAITAMYQDGTASRLLRAWFGATGLRLTESVPEFEGCG